MVRVNRLIEIHQYACRGTIRHFVLRVSRNGGREREERERERGGEREGGGRERERQTDRHTESERERERERQRERDRQTDTQTHRHTDTQTDGQTYRQRHPAFALGSLVEAMSCDKCWPCVVLYLL